MRKNKKRNTLTSVLRQIGWHYEWIQQVSDCRSETIHVDLRPSTAASIQWNHHHHHHHHVTALLQLVLISPRQIRFLMTPFQNIRKEEEINPFFFFFLTKIFFLSSAVLSIMLRHSHINKCKIIRAVGVYQRRTFLGAKTTSLILAKLIFYGGP